MSLLVFAFASNVLAADVSGTWALKMKGPQGDENFDIVIKSTGENLAVTATHPSLQAMNGTGTLKGSAVKFSLKATGQMQVQFDFTGTLTGNKMAGTREIVMASGSGGGAPGGAAPGGASGFTGEGRAAGGAAPGGAAPGGAAPGGAAPGGAAPGGAAPGGDGGGSMDMSSISKDWTAEKK